DLPPAALPYVERKPLARVPAIAVEKAPGVMGAGTGVIPTDVVRATALQAPRHGSSVVSSERREALLLVGEGIRRAPGRIGRRPAAGLLELLLEDLLLVPVLLHRARELLVESALLGVDAVHEVVEVLGRRLLLVGPHHRSRLRVHLQQGTAAGTSD